MILYHGSNIEEQSIDLSKSNVGKDFGCGFYLTEDYGQAERMANRRVRIYGGEPIVSSFEYDRTSAEASGLAIKEFSSYTNEWADFILANRGNDSRTQIHKYDIVYGPIANDDVGF